MYLTNNFGRVVYIEDQELVETLLKRKGMRKSTPEEVQAHKLQKKATVLAGDTSTHKDNIYYQTVSSSADGYGMSRDFLRSELLEAGTYLDETYAGQKVGLLYSYPYGVLQMRNDVRVIFTMFESDKIPQDWPDYLNEADEVIVPSRWCRDVFARAGVKATVVPLGYNDRKFQYIDRPVPVDRHEPFTFLMYNSFNVRKGFKEVFEAFTQEFRHDEPVRMVFKTTHTVPPIPLPRSVYPNIEIICGAVPESELIEILGRSHCFVYPSRGEGFGITPLEAMATGIPAIVPNAHGISEYFNHEYMLEAKVKEKCPALYNRFKGQDVGEMVVCDVEDLRRKMRYAYTHQAEMKQLGLEASRYVKAYTYRQTAKKLNAILLKWQNANVAKRADEKVLRVAEL